MTVEKEANREAYEIEKMMATPGYQIYMGYVEQQIQATLIEMEKAATESDWRMQQGTLKGMRLIVQIPKRLVERARDVK